ncbi:hypothetical protein SAMN02787144_1004273 [Streptomyces atratus]|uniref:EamA-like transporter family protein n=1 Tax=Streptomyces atratus TaxID=1893 RepID=A0A1K1YHE9_STRAR|nr:hypothetical protein SAMN02787144_1004273 [Streptomyces atratus]
MRLCELLHRQLLAQSTDDQPVAFPAVAALRETGILVAAVIATLFFREPFGRLRLVAGAVVPAGVGLMQEEVRRSARGGGMPTGAPGIASPPLRTSEPDKRAGQVRRTSCRFRYVGGAPAGSHSR